MTRHDFLLTWCSELRVGDLTEFRVAHDWLLADVPEIGRPKPNTSISSMSTLGYLEVDWTKGEWSVAPPVLTLLPQSGAVCLLTGARTQPLLDAIEAVESDDSLSEIAPPTRHPQSGAPTAYLFPVDSSDALEKLATRLGVKYEYCVSERLAALLPSIDGFLEGCPRSASPRGFEVKRFNPTLFRWFETPSDGTPGLYQYEAWGPPQYRWRVDDAVPTHVDLATGVFAELRRVGQSGLGFRERGNSGELAVPLGVPLPALHARTAGLCSGLAPRLVRPESGLLYLVYANVPRAIADRIAQSLGQLLIPVSDLVGRRPARA